MDVKVADSSPPATGQFLHLEALRWSRSPSRKMIYAVISLINEVKDKKELERYEPLKIVSKQEQTSVQWKQLLLLMTNSTSTLHRDAVRIGIHKYFPTFACDSV